MLAAPILTGISDTDEWLMGVGSRAAWTLLWLECNEHHERPLPPAVGGYLRSSSGCGRQAEGNEHNRRLTSERTLMLPPLPPAGNLRHFSYWILMRVEPLENETLHKILHRESFHSQRWFLRSSESNLQSRGKKKVRPCR